jgi:X-Pro dipeptidyl-peptidase
VITLDSSDLSVELGGSITVGVTAVDEFGNRIGDVTDEVTLSSNYSVDVIEGNTVTFPHASSHIITATLGALTSTVTVEVSEPVVLITPTATPTPTATATPAGTPTSALPVTGTDSARILVSGLVLLLIGMVVLLVLVRRRHP